MMAFLLLLPVSVAVLVVKFQRLALQVSPMRSSRGWPWRTAPVTAAGFCSVPVFRGLLAGVGEDFAAGTLRYHLGFSAHWDQPWARLAAFGTECPRRAWAPAQLAADRELSPISVMTSTSSNRLISAAGLILIIRNGSLSWSGVDQSRCQPYNLWDKFGRPRW